MAQAVVSWPGLRSRMAMIDPATNLTVWSILDKIDA